MKTNLSAVVVLLAPAVPVCHAKPEFAGGVGGQPLALPGSDEHDFDTAVRGGACLTGAVCGADEKGVGAGEGRR